MRKRWFTALAYIFLFSTAISNSNLHGKSVLTGWVEVDHCPDCGQDYVFTGFPHRCPNRHDNEAENGNDEPAETDEEDQDND